MNKIGRHDQMTSKRKYLEMAPISHKNPIYQLKLGYINQDRVHFTIFYIKKNGHIKKM